MFTRDPWDKGALDELMEYVRENADEKYRDFHLKLVPGLKCMYGVRIPQLRKLGGEIAKGDWRSFLALEHGESYEELMIRGIVIGKAKCDVEERLNYVTDFLPLIDNWAVCDCFAAGLKPLSRDKGRLWNFLIPLTESREEYILRFAMVMLMDYFVDDEYIDKVLDIYKKTSHDAYYVKMGQAWGISLCFCRFPEKTLAWLRDSPLDDDTFNMTIQKICDSRRVEPRLKEQVRGMRRKKRGVER